MEGTFPGKNGSNTYANTRYMGHDAVERVTASEMDIQTDRYTSQCIYDLAGELRTETYPSGKKMQTIYDQAGR